MINVIDKDRIALARDLAGAIVKISKGTVTTNIAELVASRVVTTLNFENTAVAHKGVNWFAKELIDNYDLSSIVEA